MSLLPCTGSRRVRGGHPTSQLRREGAKLGFSTVASWGLAPGVTDPGSRSWPWVGSGEAERVTLRESDGGLRGGVFREGQGRMKGSLSPLMGACV